jgi:hypothetical protein
VKIESWEFRNRVGICAEEETEIKDIHNGNRMTFKVYEEVGVNENAVCCLDLCHPMYFDILIIVNNILDNSSVIFSHGCSNAIYLIFSKIHGRLPLKNYITVYDNVLDKRIRGLEHRIKEEGFLLKIMI